MTEQNGRQCAIASFALLITNNHIMYTPIYIIMSGWHSNDLLVEQRRCPEVHIHFTFGSQCVEAALQPLWHLVNGSGQMFVNCLLRLRERSSEDSSSLAMASLYLMMTEDLKEAEQAKWNQWRGGLRDAVKSLDGISALWIRWNVNYILSQTAIYMLLVWRTAWRTLAKHAVWTEWTEWLTEKLIKDGHLNHR